MDLQWHHPFSIFASFLSRKCCVTSKKSAMWVFFRAWLDSCCHVGTWPWKNSPPSLTRTAKCHQGFMYRLIKMLRVQNPFYPLLCVWRCLCVALQCSGSECIWEAEQSRRIRHGHGPELRYCIHMEIKINSSKAAVKRTDGCEIPKCTNALNSHIK